MMAKMMIIMMVITMVVMMIMVTVLNGDGGDDLTFQTDENDSDLTTDEDDATALLNKQVSIYDRSVCVCMRLAQLIRSLTANQKVPVSIPDLAEGKTLGDLLLPHRTICGQGC